MNFLKRKKKVHRWEEIVVHNDEYVVTDWHETFQYWLPKAIVMVVCGLGFYATLWPGFFVPIIVLVLAGLIDKIFERWGKLIRLVGLVVLVSGLGYLIYLLDHFQLPPAP